MTEHPITPPPELVQQWIGDYYGCPVSGELAGVETAIAARRPKPPSLKEQALTALSEADQGLNESEWQQRSDTIRRALEALPE
jgi:hypothetical protein